MVVAVFVVIPSQKGPDVEEANDILAMAEQQLHQAIEYKTVLVKHYKEVQSRMKQISKDPELDEASKTAQINILKEDMKHTTETIDSLTKRAPSIFYRRNEAQRKNASQRSRR